MAIDFEKLPSRASFFAEGEGGPVALAETPVRVEPAGADGNTTIVTRFAKAKPGHWLEVDGRRYEVVSVEKLPAGLVLTCTGGN